MYIKWFELIHFGHLDILYNYEFKCVKGQPTHQKGWLAVAPSIRENIICLLLTLR